MLIKQYNIHIIITWKHFICKKQSPPPPPNIFREWQNLKLDNISLVDGVVWMKITVLLKGGYFCLYIDGLVQNCNFSSVLAMEILQFCTKPIINQSIKSSFVKGAGAHSQNAPCRRRSHALRSAPVRRGRLPSTVFYRWNVFTSVFSMANSADDKFC